MRTLLITLCILSATTAHAEDPYKPIWKERNHKLAITNYVLIAADIATTRAALAHGREANPVLRAGIKMVGINGALSLDGLVRVLLVHHLAKQEGMSPVLGVLAAVSGVATVSNMEVK